MTAGLYVHVPYCRRICPYCDFNVVRHKDPPWPRLQAAMLAEMQARAGCLAGPLASIYFGGGTPSLAPVAWLTSMLAAIRAQWPVAADAEITLELEPATLQAAELAVLRQAGFNRISMGWQSTHDRLLQTLGRGHSAADSRAALAAARTAGFTNISLDLMFAVPGQTKTDLQQDLVVVVDLKPSHVSLYNLTYHQGTPFARRRARGLLQVVGEGDEVAMLERAVTALAAAGYARYEVSNFAQANMRAVHNAGYWRGTPYLGIGPGAHSFVRQGWARAWRWENLRKPQAYMQAWTQPSARAAVELPQTPSLQAALPPADQVNFVEELDAAARMLERMLLSLRTTDGIDLREPALRGFAEPLQRGVATLTQRRWATVQGHRLRPTDLGLRFADAAAALFA